MAQMKVGSGIFATPPISTKILNGAGGGSSAGTISARAPYFLIKPAARSRFPPLNRLRRSASPPLRPTKYSARHPAIEPSVAIVAYNTIRSGWLHDHQHDEQVVDFGK